MKKSTTIALGILLVFVGLVWSAGARKSETIDEGLTICGGAFQVRRMDPNLMFGVSPVIRWISGLPAVAFGDAKLLPTPPPEPTLLSLEGPELFNWSRDLLYMPGNDHDLILFWGRLPFALIAGCIGWLLFAEVRRRLGDAPALLALTTFCFIPDVLAQAQFAVTDLSSTLTIVLVVIALTRLLELERPRDDYLMGAALGLLMLVKMSAAVLVPAPLAIALWRAPNSRWKRLLRIAVAAWAVLVCGYFPDPRLFPHEFAAADLAQLVGGSIESSSTAVATVVLRYLPVPDSFLRGLVFRKLLSARGQLGYFHGQVGSTGWWYYFPVAVFLKYPPALLLTALAGLFATARNRAFSARHRLAWTALPLVLFAAAMTQNVNIGVRSVIFVAPFFALWTAFLFDAVRGWGRALVGTMAATVVLSGLTAWPDFLAYFNPLMGGTPAADRWLVDSNLDWGQDLPELAKTLQRRGISEVRLAYFGAGVPSHWSIAGLDPTVVAPGWYAVSRSSLAGFWPPGDQYAWLRGVAPVELVGGSIALFEVSPEMAAAELYRKGIKGLDEWKMNAALDDRFVKNDLPAAIRGFEQILSRTPDHYGARYQLAAAWDASGNAREAREAWLRFLPLAEQMKDDASREVALKRIRALGTPPAG